RPDEAIEKSQKALQIQNTGAVASVAYMAWGNALVELKRYSDARDPFRKALEINPNIAEIYGTMSWIEVLLHHPRQAIAAALKGIELDPSLLWIKTNLVHGYLFEKEEEKARTIFSENQSALVEPDQTFSQAILEDFKEFQT